MGKIGLSEILLIMIVAILAAILLVILFIDNTKKSKDEKKAQEETKKDAEKKEEAEEQAPIEEKIEYVSVARTININKILGKSKEERDKYFEQILSAKTPQEINKINEDKTLKHIIKPTETEKLDEFVLFTEDDIYENTPPPEKIEVGKKKTDKEED